MLSHGAADYATVSSVLVTGGTGMLGSALVPRLVAAGHSVRVMSRQEDPAIPAGASAVRADLTADDGADAALAGVEVVAHAATSPFRHTRDVDVAATRDLLAACARAGVEHFVYPGIVGVDRHPLAYYKAKFEAEQVVEEAAVPSSIARGTQFHELLDTFIGSIARFPTVFVGRKFVFQPVDAGEYAQVLVDLVDAGPSGRVPDTGGPEVRELRDLVRVWLDAHGRRRWIAPVPVPGKLGRAFREGFHTCPDCRVGTVRWEDHLGV